MTRESNIKKEPEKVPSFCKGFYPGHVFIAVGLAKGSEINNQQGLQPKSVSLPLAIANGLESIIINGLQPTKTHWAKALFSFILIYPSVKTDGNEGIVHCRWLKPTDQKSVI